MKKNLLFLFLSLPLIGFGQFQSSIDVISGVDYSYRMWDVGEGNMEAFVFYDNRENDDWKVNYRFGFNFNYHIQSNFYFKTGLRFAQVGYKSERGGLRLGHDFETDPNQSFPIIDYIANQKSINYTFLEIPLMVRYELPKNRLTPFVEAGLSPNIYLETVAVAQSDATKPYQKKYRKRVTGVHPVSVVWSLSVGVNYQLSSNFQLFAQPVVRYHLTNLTDGKDLEHLYNVGLEIGMRTRLK